MDSEKEKWRTTIFELKSETLIFKSDQFLLVLHIEKNHSGCKCCIVALTTKMGFLTFTETASKSLLILTYF